MCVLGCSGLAGKTPNMSKVVTRSKCAGQSGFARHRGRMQMEQFEAGKAKSQYDKAAIDAIRA